MRIADLLAETAKQLAAAGIDDARREARLLLAHALGKSHSQLFLAEKGQVTVRQRNALAPLLVRRLRREPLAYIAQEQEFWSLPFFVDERVLIPRPETEFLVEQVLAVPPKPGLICDLCCGSGVIAIILAKELRRQVLAIDISPGALAVTRRNARRHGQEERVWPLAADLFTALTPRPLFPLVVTNPPYVSQAELAAGLQPEVALFEPRLALDGGDEGLRVIARIREILPKFLLPAGEVFMEIGYSQGEAVAALFRRKLPDCHNFSEVEILKDYASRDRVVHARLA
ncbi:MAG: peptide chain release factor N(5)-glutamine methyltransferase [Desulfobulbaceae bacterium]|jgi:release factor glutamine methyltransferase|nr:peptide chain release factor N(5)-glutamine methyltransferase [Desulfobulbaceae bacterium]